MAEEATVMPKKGYYERMADCALHEYERCSPEQLRRQVIMVLKEVQRDTRHRASELASELACDMMSIIPPKPPARHLGGQREKGNG